MNATLTIYTLLSFVIFFLCAKISYKYNLLDQPNKRKIHSEATAYTGGIAISVILLFAIILFDNFYKNLSIILSIAFLVSIFGLIDDKYQLNIGGKLSLQIIPIFYLVIFESLTLNSIGAYNFFELDLGTFGIPFTFLCVLFLINAFNYFDGVDGILGLTSISVLCILYFLISDKNIQIFLITILVPVILFLCFNFSIFKLPKLFLGDSGSLLLGFIISFTLIYFAKQNLVHPILLAWSIVIFVYEFLSLNLIRIKKNQDPFKPGQDHLHHIILNKTNSVLITNICITLGNIFLFLIGYLSFLLINAFVSFVLFIFLFLFFLIIRNKYS